MLKTKKLFLPAIIALMVFLFLPLCHAATLDKTNGDPGIPWNGTQKMYVVSNAVDITNVANGDVIQALDIKAKTFVFDVFVEIVTAAGSATTATATVGDGSGASGWDAETNLAAAAATLTHGASGTDTYATSGKYYSAADTIDLTATVSAGPISAGEFKIFAVCTDLN